MERAWSNVFLLHLCEMRDTAVVIGQQQSTDSRGTAEAREQLHPMRQAQRPLQAEAASCSAGTRIRLYVHKAVNDSTSQEIFQTAEHS